MDSAQAAPKKGIAEAVYSVDIDPDAPAPKSRSSLDTDEYQLAAIAGLNRGGDPVEVLERAESVARSD